MSPDPFSTLSAVGSVSSAVLIPTAVGLVTSTSFWGAVAHSLGLLPEEAFIHAEQIGLTLPEMPR